MHVNSELIYGGGLERIIVDLMTHNHDTNNYLCVLNDKWSKEHIDILDSDSVLLCNRKEGTKNPFANLNTVYKACKFIWKNQIQIIHCHDTFSLKFAYLLKKIMKVKVVFTVHATFIYNEEKNKYPVDKYFAISESVYQTVKKYVPQEKIDLIYNGVNLETFREANTSLNQQLDSINIACVGRIVPEKKGQDVLLKALGVLKNNYHYKNFKCYFAGAPLDNSTMDDMNEIVRNNGLENHVEFLGNIEEVEKLYAKSDIFVLPSRSEGFGLVVVEALAAGCKVIVSKLEGPLEIVKENEEYGLYFEKENFRELADKLQVLVKDNNSLKHSRYNEKTQSYLDENFSLELMIQNYNKSYSTCLMNSK
ncbi:glycosyltransferase family 4 protein [Peribacillus frigoritolerans]|uniref:glycosyltransferase family 4 protein n=1 Tax=Peribacillus frigoritolerans TaxID=450367 RepID=UPI0024C19E6C|nr:glycosyltransferase family 4 protein [Peribacillus frigoritolerans]WHX65534.1 glycosyltransferase family 4 protein [Peribacillus frigoritolerans]